MSKGIKALVGRVEQKENNFGELETKFSLGPNDIEKLLEFKTAKGWINITLKFNKDKTKMYAELWKPGDAPVVASEPAPAGDLPF